MLKLKSFTEDRLLRERAPPVDLPRRTARRRARSSCSSLRARFFCTYNKVLKMKNINIVLPVPDALAARLLNGRAVAGKSQAVAIVKDEILKILAAFVSDAPLPTKDAPAAPVDVVVAEEPKATKKTRKSAAKKESAA